MAGEARSSNFMLGTATVMIGPRDKLYELNPQEHSLGLVKNFVCESTKEQLELGQGVQNTTVFTRSTGSTTRGTFEAYEYTPKNLAYALSLDGGSVMDKPGTPRKTTALSTNGSDGTHTLTVDSPTTPQTIAIGDFVTLREPSNNNVYLAKVQQVTPSMIVRVDVGNTKKFEIGTVVQACNVLAVGNSSESEEYAAKVVGQMADGTWVSLFFPRIRITSGMTLAFSTDNYGNQPFEFKPMQLIAGEKFYADYAGKMANLVIDGTKSPIV